MLLILGIVIGGIIGFFSSYLMWRVQLKYNKSRVAHGFYLEISSLEKPIGLYAKAFDSPGPVEIGQPFYSDGLFFVFCKEIFAFKRDLSKRLFEFYNCLLRADEARRVAPSNPFFKPANDAMKDYIKEAYALLPNLKELLRKEFS